MSASRTRPVGFLRRLVPGALAGVLFGCDASAPAGLTPPELPDVSVQTVLRGHVDLVKGTLSFEPAPVGFARVPGEFATASSAPTTAMSAAIYGDQNVTVRLYNTTVSQSIVAGKKQFTANVGVRNLLSHHIGDEQAGASPPDTMGVYVFFNSGPTVTQTTTSCPACTVIVKNQHGTLTFTAAGQKYFHWQERLGPSGGGSDTTRARKSWIFEADTQVTNFTFDVLVSAAWANPNESRWKIDYQADSLPDTQSEPRWRLRRVGTGGTHSVIAGALSIAPGIQDNELHFYRSDSMAVTTNAYVEARVRYNGNRNGQPTPRVMIDDDVKLVAFGMGRDEVGFIDTNNAYIGTIFSMNTTSAFHVYQLRKYAADSAVFFVDGTRRGVIAYASFSNTPYAATAPLIQFGQRNRNDGDTSDFDYVIYEIGVVQP